MACDYCLNGYDQSKPLIKRSTLTLPVDNEVLLDGNGTLSVFVFKDGIWAGTTEIEVNYCPMCGSNLGRS